MSVYNRRNFLKTSLMGGVAAAFINPIDAVSSLGLINQYDASVSITTGDNRADLAFRSLTPFSDRIARSIGNRRVILKPNNVSIKNQLSATHADTLEGVLEFLKSIGKLENAVIAESAADGPALEGFDNYGYTRLLNRYPVKLLDLDHQPFKIIHVFDEKDFRPHAVRISSLFNPDSFIVSVARMKTHDRVFATLSLKNIVFGAPIKSPSKNPDNPRPQNDKRIAHGSGTRAINYNLFALSGQLHPDLAIIDGFEGMEGNGPTRGTAVDHRVCVSGMDWLAADRVALELMGIDFAKVGYMNYCAQAGSGVADLNKIEIIGEPINKHKRSYKLSDNFEQQLDWMKPPVS